jgi:hypothetical protein
MLRRDRLPNWAGGRVHAHHLYTEVMSMNDPGQSNAKTARVRKVLRLAQQEAQCFQQTTIGTEHLLLGLIREGGGVATMVLRGLGVDLKTLRSTVEVRIEQEDRLASWEIGLTPAAKRVFELAPDEALLLHHRHLGTEHLLLGLLREGEGIAAGALVSLGLTLDQVRAETLRVLNQASAALEARKASGGSAPDALRVGVAEQGWIQPPYQFFQITSEALEKTPIGKRARQVGVATVLGQVDVHTGGEFTLTLYTGMAEDASIVTVIANPPTGASFPCPRILDQGLAYTLTGAPGSVTVCYYDLPLVDSLVRF